MNIFFSLIFFLFSFVGVFANNSDSNLKDLGKHFFELASQDEKTVNSTILKDIIDSIPQSSNIFQAEELLEYQLNIPILHHLLNLYRLSPRSSDKRNLVYIAEQGIIRGLDPNIGLKDDPPLYFKSLLIRELKLTQTILKNNKKNLNTEIIARSRKFLKFLKLLYSLPMEIVPITKLLLTSEKIFGSLPVDFLNSIYQNASLTNATIRAIFDSASLEKPTIKGTELLEFSDHFVAFYNRLLSFLVSNSTLSSKLLSIAEINESLNELIFSVFQEILEVLLVNNDRSEISIEHFLDLHVVIDEDQGRNAFHYLIISNSTRVIDSLIHLYEIYPSSELKNLLAQRLLAALEYRDYRGHTPISMGIVRYGNDSLIVQIGRKLFQKLQYQKIHQVLDDSLPSFDISQNQIISHVALDGEASVSSPEIPESDGGWKSKRLNVLMNGESLLERCDVLEVWNTTLPSPQEFFEKYINLGIPVVFRNALSNPKNRISKLKRVFSYKKFIKLFGNVPVTTSILPYGESFGVPTNKKTLKDIAKTDEIYHFSDITLQDFVETGLSINNSALYAFSVPNKQWSDRLYSDVPVPDTLSPSTASFAQNFKQTSIYRGAGYNYELQFYLGGIGTGAPVHYHGHAINSLAYGEKHWVMYPPAKSFYSTIPAVDFFYQLSQSPSNNTEFLHNLGDDALRCTQRAGDVFYVPTLWGHATLNTKQSIGVAHEFTVESYAME